MGKETKNLVRVNMYMSETLRDFYRQYANEMGTTMSAVMIMALKTYMDQQTGLNMGKDFKAMLEQMQRLQPESLHE